MGDNNHADKRPRIYTGIANSDVSVEVTVQGSEGETTSDIEGIAERRLDDAVKKAKQSEEEDEDKMYD